MAMSASIVKASSRLIPSLALPWAHDIDDDGDGHDHARDHQEHEAVEGGERSDERGT
jgi:hypothetical protein